jgi:hypothetical protein
MMSRLLGGKLTAWTSQVPRMALAMFLAMTGIPCHPCPLSTYGGAYIGRSTHGVQILRLCSASRVELFELVTYRVEAIPSTISLYEIAVVARTSAREASAHCHVLDAGRRLVVGSAQEDIEQVAVN